MSREEQLAELAAHLIHEECPHVLDEALAASEIEAQHIGGHCEECTLEHLQKLVPA